MLEKFLWQFIRIAGQSFAGIEHAEEIQTAAANFHQFFNGHIPASDGADHVRGVFAIVESPCGAVDELAEFGGVEHGVEDFGLIRKADFFFGEAVRGLRRAKTNLLETVEIEIANAFFIIWVVLAGLMICDERIDGIDERE